MRVWKRHRTADEVIAMTIPLGISVDASYFQGGGDHLVLYTPAIRVLYNVLSGRFFGTLTTGETFNSDKDQPDSWYQKLVEFFYTDEEVP